MVKWWNQWYLSMSSSSFTSNDFIVIYKNLFVYVLCTFHLMKFVQLFALLMHSAFRFSLYKYIFLFLLHFYFILQVKEHFWFDKISTMNTPEALYTFFISLFMCVCDILSLGCFTFYVIELFVLRVWCLLAIKFHLTLISNITGENISFYLKFFPFDLIKISLHLHLFVRWLVGSFVWFTVLS